MWLCVELCDDKQEVLKGLEKTFGNISITEA